MERLDGLPSGVVIAPDGPTDDVVQFRHAVMIMHSVLLNLAGCC